MHKFIRQPLIALLFGISVVPTGQIAPLNKNKTQALPQSVETSVPAQESPSLPCFPSSLSFDVQKICEAQYKFFNCAEIKLRSPKLGQEFRDCNKAEAHPLITSPISAVSCLFKSREDFFSVTSFLSSIPNKIAKNYFESFGENLDESRRQFSLRLTQIDQNPGKKLIFARRTQAYSLANEEDIKKISAVDIYQKWFEENRNILPEKPTAWLGRKSTDPLDLFENETTPAPLEWQQVWANVYEWATNDVPGFFCLDPLIASDKICTKAVEIWTGTKSARVAVDLSKKLIKSVNAARVLDYKTNFKRWYDYSLDDYTKFPTPSAAVQEVNKTPFQLTSGFKLPAKDKLPKIFSHEKLGYGYRNLFKFWQKDKKFFVKESQFKDGSTVVGNRKIEDLKNEVAWTQRLDKEGLGPKFHALTKTDDGYYSIVTDYIDGESLVKLNPSSIKYLNSINPQPEVLDQLKKIRSFIIDNKVSCFDLQIRLNATSAKIVDPEFFTAAEDLGQIKQTISELNKIIDAVDYRIKTQKSIEPLISQPARN